MIFVIFFILSLFAEIISNDKPIVLMIDDKLYFPIVISYTDKEFGGYFDTEADYKDKFISVEYVSKKGKQISQSLEIPIGRKIRQSIILEKRRAALKAAREANR